MLKFGGPYSYVQILRYLDYPPGNESISHRKGSSENHRLESAFAADMLVPWRVYFINSVSKPFSAHIHGQCKQTWVFEFGTMELVYRNVKIIKNHGTSIGGQCHACWKPKIICIPKSCVLFAPSAGHTAIADDKRTLPAHPKHSPKPRVLSYLKVQWYHDSSYIMQMAVHELHWQWLIFLYAFSNPRMLRPTIHSIWKGTHVQKHFILQQMHFIHIMGI